MTGSSAHNEWRSWRRERIGAERHCISYGRADLHLILEREVERAGGNCGNIMIQQCLLVAFEALRVLSRGHQGESVASLAEERDQGLKH